MIGIFDSGVGGLASFSELRRLLPLADIAYLADRKNAPYGTKKKDVLKRLVCEDIELLRRLGCNKILIACCTASTVHRELPEESRRISFPIIKQTANAAAGYRSVAVIATEHTVRSHAFSKEIKASRSALLEGGHPEANTEGVGKVTGADIALRTEGGHTDSSDRKSLPPASPSIGRLTADWQETEAPLTIAEIAAQELVSLVEGGGADGRLDAEGRRTLDRVADRIRQEKPEALILGCTHFSHLAGELSARLPGCELLIPAKLGARAFADTVSRDEAHGHGRCIYTEK